MKTYSKKIYFHTNFIMEVSMDYKTAERLDAIEKALEKLVGKLNKLYYAVIGDEEMDQEGYLHRLKRAEKEIEKLQALRYKLVGAFIGGGVIWAVTWELIKKIIFK